jgi:hypothetical protein
MGDGEAIIGGAPVLWSILDHQGAEGNSHPSFRKVLERVFMLFRAFTSTDFGDWATVSRDWLQDIKTLDEKRRRNVSDVSNPH